MIQQYDFKGFTLPEMMVAVAIMSILVAIAIPSYRHYIRSARLHDAQHLLLKNVQHLERHYANHFSFKKNSTTWADLLHDSDEYGTGTEHFCLKMQGNAKGVNKNDNRFIIKAVARDKTAEPRVLLINHDSQVMICESSSSSCDEQGFFAGRSDRIDKQCRLF